jgi:autotransporter-associated beta strand protein
MNPHNIIPAAIQSSPIAPRCRRFRYPVILLAAASLLPWSIQSARAASATWISTSNATFANAANWNGGIPGVGATNNTSSATTDNATFNTSTGLSITVDGGRNINNIFFDGNVGSFTLTSGSLVPTSGGVIQLNSTVTSSGQTETIGVPLLVVLSGGTNSFINNAPTSDVFNISSAAIKPSTTSNLIIPTLILGGNNTGANTISGAITANGGGTFAIRKTGAGTWDLTNAGTGIGSIALNQGLLGVNFSAGVTSNIITSGANLTLNGGTLAFSGASGTTDTQALGGVTVATGASSVTFAQNSATSITVTGTVSRSGNGGTVDFTLPTTGNFVATVVAGTTGTGAGGILIYNNGGSATPFATVGGNDWAALSGTVGGNNLVGLSTLNGYTPATATMSGVQGNVDATLGVTTTAMGSTASTIESLRFNVNQATTVSLGASTTSLYGILVTSAVGSNTTTISGNRFRNAVGDINIVQNNTGGGLTISAQVLTGAVTKSGPGLLTLSNVSNGYALGTYVNGGTTDIVADLSLGAAPGSFTAGNVVMNGGALQLASSFNLSANRGITLNSNGGTFDTQSFSSTYSGIISGAGAFTKAGSGTLTLNNSNTYTGATTVNGTLIVSGALTGTPSVTVNGTLQLSAVNALNSAARLTLNSGVLNALNNPQTLADLTSTGASTLDLGIGSTAAILNFANSSADAWTGTLTIRDWNGNAAGAGPDEIFFGSTSSGLTGGQVADITFLNPIINGVAETGSYSATLLGDGELVTGAAIPEPGTWATILSGCGMLAGIQRLRKRRVGI